MSKEVPVSRRRRKRISTVPNPVDEDFEPGFEDEESLCPKCGKPMRVVRVIRPTDAADALADGLAEDLAGA